MHNPLSFIYQIEQKMSKVGIKKAFINYSFILINESYPSFYFFVREEVKENGNNFAQM